MKQTDFAEQLTQALDLRGLSAADLSRATGVSDGTISCYKSGGVCKSPPPCQGRSWQDGEVSNQL